MDNQVHNQIVSFIWGIADDCLRDVYVRGKYRDVILPMTVIRRLDGSKKMKVKYILVKNIYYDDTQFIRYGIAVLDISDTPPAVIRTVADLTGDAFTAQALANKCNFENISLTDLDAIIDEFLSRNEL